MFTKASKLQTDHGAYLLNGYRVFCTRKYNGQGHEAVRCPLPSTELKNLRK